MVDSEELDGKREEKERCSKEQFYLTPSRPLFCSLSSLLLLLYLSPSFILFFSLPVLHFLLSLTNDSLGATCSCSAALSSTFFTLSVRRSGDAGEKIEGEGKLVLVTNQVDPYFKNIIQHFVQLSVGNLGNHFT